MASINISIGFKETGVGNATILLTGSSEITYFIDQNDTRIVDLPYGSYSLKVDGTSGSKIELTVTDGERIIVSDSNFLPFFSMENSFIVEG